MLLVFKNVHEAIQPLERKKYIHRKLSDYHTLTDDPSELKHQHVQSQEIAIHSIRRPKCITRLESI